MAFGRWYPLSRAGLDDGAPPGAAAVQLRGEPLLTYPSGKSAMVFYAFVAGDCRAALTRHFADELAAPGARGLGPLRFRVDDEHGAKERVAALLASFEARFGAPPRLHDVAHETADGASS